MSRIRFGAQVASVAVTALLGTACGDGHGNPEADPAGDTLDEVTAVVRRYAADTPESSFAGLWVDRKAGVVHAGFATDVEEHARRLKERLSRPELLRIFDARYSLAELERVRSRIEPEELERHGLQFSATSIDPRTNSVEVRLANPSRRAERILHDLYGPTVRLHGRASRFQELGG